MGLPTAVCNRGSFRDEHTLTAVVFHNFEAYGCLNMSDVPLHGAVEARLPPSSSDTVAVYFMIITVHLMNAGLRTQQ